MCYIILPVDSGGYREKSALLVLFQCQYHSISNENRVYRCEIY